MMIKTIALAFAVALSSSPIREEIQVDAVEINSCYNEDGKHVLDQILLRRWYWCHGRRNHWITEWRVIKDEMHLSVVRHGDRTTVKWFEEGNTIRVSARSFYRTRTIGDPELNERRIMGDEYRTPYLKPPAMLP